MIQAIGKKNWAQDRFIPIDQIEGFNLVLKDGSNYPISKEQVVIIFDNKAHSADGTDVVLTTKFDTEKPKAVSNPRKESKKDEVQDNDK